MKRLLVILSLFLLAGCSAVPEEQAAFPLGGKWVSGGTYISLDGGVCSVLSDADIPPLTYCADDNSIVFSADVSELYEKLMGMSCSDLLRQGYISQSDLEPFRICYTYALSGDTLTLTPDAERSDPGAFDDLSPVTLIRAGE